MVAAVIEGTITLIVLYLVVSNADGFSKAVSSVGSFYTNAVVVLQGRPQVGQAA